MSVPSPHPLILFFKISISFKENKKLEQRKHTLVCEPPHSETASSCLRGVKQNDKSNLYADHQGSRLLATRRGLLFFQLVAKVPIKGQPNENRNFTDVPNTVFTLIQGWRKWNAYFFKGTSRGSGLSLRPGATENVGSPSKSTTYLLVDSLSFISSFLKGNACHACPKRALQERSNEELY